MPIAEVAVVEATFAQAVRLCTVVNSDKQAELVELTCLRVSSAAPSVGREELVIGTTSPTCSTSALSGPQTLRRWVNLKLQLTQMNEVWMGEGAPMAVAMRP